MTNIGLVKNTHHVNLVLDGTPLTDGGVRRVLSWLGQRSQPIVPAAAIDSHEAEIMRRAAGGLSLGDVAVRNRQIPAVARTVGAVMRNYRFERYELPYIAVSVDLLDAANELGLPASSGAILEVFVVGGAEPVGRALPQLLREMLAELPIRFAFGGYSSFTAHYAAAIRHPQPELKQGTEPWRVLWPLTFLHGVPKPTVRLPAESVEQCAGGLLIQVFEDLTNGYQDRYKATAEGLGLISLWELKTQP